MNRNLILAGAACALFTVFSTFIVHLVSVPGDTFEQRLLYTESTIYISRNILTIIHCLCVSLSMAAIVHVYKKTRKADFLTWGAICFLLFSVAEIVRMLSALLYANGLRKAYAQTADAVLQGQIYFQLETQWPLIGEVLFIFFILAFALGCFFMGLGLYSKKNRLDQLTGSLFLFWALQSFATLANETLFLGLDHIIFALSVTFQPAFRLLITYWLFKRWKESRVEDWALTP